MVKKIFILIIGIFLLPTILAAYDIVIEVQSVPNTEVTFRVLDINGKILDPVSGVFVEIPDATGKVYITYVSEVPKIRGSFQVGKNGEYITFNGSSFFKVNDLKTLGVNKIDLRNPNFPSHKFIPDEPEEEVVEESEESAEVESEESEEVNKTDEVADEESEEPAEIKEAGITGEVVKDSESFLSSKVVYYIIGGVVIIGFLFLIIFAARKKMHLKEGEFKVRKISREDYTKELENVERRLEQTKKELDLIKNRKSKASELRERIQRDQAELKRLEGEE